MCGHAWGERWILGWAEGGGARGREGAWNRSASDRRLRVGGAAKTVFFLSLVVVAACVFGLCRRAVWVERGTRRSAQSATGGAVVAPSSTTGAMGASQVTGLRAWPTAHCRPRIHSRPQVARTRPWWPPPRARPHRTAGTAGGGGGTAVGAGTTRCPANAALPRRAPSRRCRRSCPPGSAGSSRTSSGGGCGNDRGVAARPVHDAGKGIAVQLPAEHRRSEAVAYRGGRSGEASRP